MAIARVGQIAAATETASSTTHVITVGASGVAAGNLVVVRFFWHSNAVTLTSVTDTGGNTYSVPSSLNRAGVFNNYSAAIAYSIITTPLVNGNTITITLSSAAVAGHYAVEFSGIDASPLDQTGEAEGSVTTPPWSVAALGATTEADELLVAMATGAIGNKTSTPDGSWLEEADRVATLENSLVCQYQIVSATGSYTASGTWSGAGDQYLAIIATFKGAAATPVVVAWITA
jgi:hypothetical protein